MDFGFSAGTAHVWIYEALSSLDDLREQPDGYNYPLPFGKPSKGHVDMALSHTVESRALALKIAHGFLTRWPGVASFPLHTVLVQNSSADALPQTVAEDFAGSEVQVLLSRQPSLDALVSEFGGNVINGSDADLQASAMATLVKMSHAEIGRDTIVGVIQANKGDIWILTRAFDRSKVHGWDLLEPTAARHVSPFPPSSVVRVLADCSTEDREYANRLALSFARRVSHLSESVILGTFFVNLEPEQIKLVLDSGQWPLVS